MSPRIGGIARPTRLGLLTAILWAATHPNERGRSQAETLALIARWSRDLIDREALP